MASKKIADAAGVPLEKKSFKLSHALRNGDVLIDELEITEATLQDEAVAASKAPKEAGEMEQKTFLLAQLTGVPHSCFKALKMADYRKLMQWLERPFLGTVDVEGERATFKLSGYSIEVDGRSVDAITVREPDLACAIVVEKVEGELAVTVASIAELSGLTARDVRQLRMRDVRVIKAWLIPFVNGSD